MRDWCAMVFIQVQVNYNDPNVSLKFGGFQSEEGVV